MERLLRQIQVTQKQLQKPEASWTACSASIGELVTAVESITEVENYQEVVRHLLILSSDIGAQLTSIRSKLVKDVCEHLLRIVRVTGRDFQAMANALLPQLISTAKNTSAAVRQPGDKLLSEVTKTVRYDLALLRNIYIQLNHDRTRVLVLEQLRLIFVYWRDDEIVPWESDVLEIMQQGLEDQHKHVRKVAREVLCRFSPRWSGSVEELAQMLSNQAKVLLVNEHRDSGLATAIIENYPELMSKAESTLAVRSKVRKSLNRSLRLKRDQRSSEKQALATTLRRQQEQVEGKQPKSDDGTINSQTTASSKMTESNAAVRSLRSDSDDTGDSEPLKVSIDSELNDFRPLQAFVQAVDSDTSSGHPSSPLAAVPSGSNKARALIMSDVAVNQKSSEIPSKKRLDAYIASSNSAMLNSQEDLEISTLVDAQIEEETIELKSLSASDEYFSKPMPSSLAMTTLHSPSDENITFRPKIARQEDDDLPPQTYFLEMSSFELSPKMSTQSQSMDVMSDRALQSNLEAVARQCDRYDEYVSRDECDVIDREVKGGHIKSDIDKKVFLSQSRSESDANNDSVELNENQVKMFGNDMGIDDEWHFDEKRSEGTRNLSDEIGVSMYSDSESGVDTCQATSVTEQNVLQTDRCAIGFVPEDSCRTQSETEEKDDGRDGELNSVSLPKDALAGLVDLYDEVKRLRSETKSDKEYANETIREKNAHGFNDSSSPPFGLQTSARIDEAKPLICEESIQPLNRPKGQECQLKGTHSQSALSVDEQASRFDAAEKLFAAKKAPTITSCYNSPPSPKTERCVFQYERLPSQLGTKWNPLAAKARTKKVEVEEEVVAPVEAETEVTPTVDDNEVSPGLNEPIEFQAPDDKKPSSSSLTSGSSRHAIAKPSPVITEKTGPVPASSGWKSYCALVIILILSGSFCIAGILHAAKVVRDSQEYHMALQSRIQIFEAGIIESHQKVRKLEKEYAVWSEYVRKLTEEEEAHASAQMEAIQVQVQEWQRDVKADLLAFRQALSVDSLEASFEKLRVVNATKRKELYTGNV